MNRRIASSFSIAACLLAALVVNLAWDFAARDLPLARVFGGANGFPLRDAWPLNGLLHDGGRLAAWLVALALGVGVWWPWGSLERLDLGRRMQLALTPLILVMLVALLKAFSATSCPWGLHEFGGAAHFVSHWSFLSGADGGSGHCFPAGHAAAGFAFVGGYFAFRHDAPTIARRWLAGALIAGFAFGIAQQLRGAHFMSHTLWTGWLCAAVAWLLDGVVMRVRERFPWTRERVAS